jgi:hypothetical protein
MGSCTSNSNNKNSPVNAGIVIKYDENKQPISIYNASYQCAIPSIVFWKNNMIQINFDVHGDYSLGPLQPPNNSQLVYVPTGGEALTFHVAIKVTTTIDTLYRKTGSLTYKLNVIPKRNGSLHFRYGVSSDSGYKTAELCRFVPEFISENGLGTLFPNI